ncbi:MAG: hypothetical protein JRI80_04950 [Deltaproteobacteria bacterium]|nr:hypothetical protein [Deltaproteobacteria bacterium]
MSEKKVKQLRKQKEREAVNGASPVNVRATLNINVLDNGAVNVHGPIDHPEIVFDMLAGGLKALASHYANKANSKVEPSRIIRPGAVMPPNPIMKVN